MIIGGSITKLEYAPQDQLPSSHHDTSHAETGSIVLRIDLRKQPFPSSPSLPHRGRSQHPDPQAGQFPIKLLKSRYLSLGDTLPKAYKYLNIPTDTKEENYQYFCKS